jgi:hypothetical protein
MPFYGYAQLSGKVEGEGKPLPFANVLLLSAKDSSLVKGMVTNEVGLYTLENIPQGRYLVMASLVGYKKTYSVPFTIISNHDKVNQQALVLLPETYELKEVAVKAAKPIFEQQMDKLVVNVQSIITAAGSTVLDVLGRSPGVSVNQQSNSLSMSGKDGVNVLINGKPTRVPMAAVLQMLGGMQASNVEKIELITTPSAGYDAEGNAGVINIVLKKNVEYGTNGSMALTMGYGAFEKPAANVSFNHRTSKLNFYGDYSFLWNHLRQQFYNYREVTYQGQLTQTEGRTMREPYAISHTSKLGFDYSIGPRTTLSGLISGFSNKYKITEDVHTDIWQNSNLATAIDVHHREVNLWRHLMGNLNFRHSFAHDQEINLDLDYLVYDNDNPHTYTINSQYVAENITQQDKLTIGKQTPIRLWVGKADYFKTFGSKTKLETGVKATISQLENDVLMRQSQEGEWITDPELSGQMDMPEDIAAAYVNVNHQLNTKTKLQTGLRYEYTRTDLGTLEKPDLIRRRYGNFFPSVFIAHDLQKGSSLQLSYGRRITRPTYNNLAPFVYFTDPSTFFSGNIYLLPAITDALLTNYRFKESYLISLGYSYDKHPIIPWQVHVDPQTNKQYARAENLKNSHTYSLTFSFPFRISNWWQMQYNLLGTWQQNNTTYNGENVQVQAGYGRINATHTFTLPADFTLELTGFYQTRSLMGIAYMKALGTFNAGLQKKLRNEGGTLRLTIDDVFWTQRFYMVNEQASLNLHHRFLGLFNEPRVVRFTYSRNFGSKTVKAVNRRATGSDEERKRVAN